MKKKARLYILLFCTVCFFGAAPVLVAYSMGYRLDFNDMKIVATGGIYVRTFPPAESVTIDSRISIKPGVFSNNIFVQSLLPKIHTVYIQKTGYYDYYKSLPVEENQVTKLENVLLLKKNLEYADIIDNAVYFSIAPDNQNAVTASKNQKSFFIDFFSLNSPSQKQTVLIPENASVTDIKWSDNSSYALIKLQDAQRVFYYFLNTSAGAGQTPVATKLEYLDQNSQQISFNPKNPLEILYVENNILYDLKNNKPSAIIKGIITYTAYGNGILWLSEEGLLEESDALGKLISTLTAENMIIQPGASYNLFYDSEKIFLKSDKFVFTFNTSTKVFENLNAPEGTYKIITAPDSKSLVLYSDNKILLYSFVEETPKMLYEGGPITSCQWVNNDYIAFTAGDDIIISEIDYRGNINSVALPSSVTLKDNTQIQIKNPQTFYVRQSGILYVLTGNTLLASEKITP
jgi:hypothetical protein